jgi:hypothetical protein
MKNDVKNQIDSVLGNLGANDRKGSGIGASALKALSTEELGTVAAGDGDTYGGGPSGTESIRQGTSQDCMNDDYETA